MGRWLDRQSFRMLPEEAIAGAPLPRTGKGSAATARWWDGVSSAIDLARLRALLVALSTGLLFTAALVHLYRRVLAPRVVQAHIKTE